MDQLVCRPRRAAAMLAVCLAFFAAVLLSQSASTTPEDLSTQLRGVEIYPDSIEGQRITLSKGTSLPTSLPWPVEGKSVKDVSLFFWVDDAVTTVPKGCQLETCKGQKEAHYEQHLGIDIAASPGTKVRPVAEGCVVAVSSQPDPIWKNYTVVSHGPTNGRTDCPNSTNTWTTTYWHLDKIDRSKIAVGKRVTTSSTLGEVADLDESTTGDIDHLHFGFRAAPYSREAHQGYTSRCAGPGDWVNPLTFLKRKGTTIVDDRSAVFSGAWSCSMKYPLYYGTGYRALAGGTSGDAVFTVPIESSGTYKVYARWNSTSDRTTKAKFYISYAPGFAQVVTKDQTYNGTQWVLLTTLELKMNVPLTVRLNNGTSSGYLIADAILAEKQ